LDSDPIFDEVRNLITPNILGYMSERIDRLIHFTSRSLSLIDGSQVNNTNRIKEIIMTGNIVDYDLIQRCFFITGYSKTLVSNKWRKKKDKLALFIESDLWQLLLNYKSDKIAISDIVKLIEYSPSKARRLLYRLEIIGCGDLIVERQVRFSQLLTMFLIPDRNKIEEWISRLIKICPRDEDKKLEELKALIT